MKREELAAIGLEGEALEAVLGLYEKSVETHKVGAQAWQDRHAQDTGELRAQLVAAQRAKALGKALEGVQFSSHSAKKAFVTAWEATLPKEMEHPTSALPQREQTAEEQAPTSAAQAGQRVLQPQALGEGEEIAVDKKRAAAQPAQTQEILSIEAFVEQYRGQDPDAFAAPAQALPMLVQPAQQPSAFDLAGSALRRAFGLGM